MADGRHFENRYTSISQPQIVQMWRNLVCGRKFWPRRQKSEKLSWNSQIQDGGRMPYWKSFFGYNSAPYCPIKTKFGMRRHNRTHTKVWWWKCPISKIQHGGRPPFWKSLYLSREASEFDEIWYADANFDHGDGNLTKVQKFPNSRWRADAILRICFWL